MESHEPTEIQPNSFGASAWRARATEEPDEPAVVKHWRTWEPTKPYLWLLGAVLLGGLIGAVLGILRLGLNAPQRKSAEFLKGGNELYVGAGGCEHD